MASINSLSLLDHNNNTFIPNDRIQRGNAVNDFKNTLFNTNGKFLDWTFDSSLRSKFGHTLFVKEGSIKYDGGFILSPDTILQYRLTNDFPKKNLSVKIKANTESSQIDVNLGGFQCSINPSVITPGTSQGIINYNLIYEDDSTSTFPQLRGFTQFIDSFIQNNENEYQFFIDHDNEQISVLINNVVIAIENFSHLKNIKIDNQQLLSVTSGNNGDVKISELVISQTDVLKDITDNLFDLRSFLINNSLCFLDPTIPSTISGSTWTGLSPNKIKLDIISTLHIDDSHFLFDNSISSILKSDSIKNITPGELLHFSVNIWFYIQHSNDINDEQALLVIGDVGPSNKSITLSIQKETTSPSFKLSLKQYPSKLIICLKLTLGILYIQKD